MWESHFSGTTVWERFIEVTVNLCKVYGEVAIAGENVHTFCGSVINESVHKYYRGNHTIYVY